MAFKDKWEDIKFKAKFARHAGKFEEAYQFCLMNSSFKCKYCGEEMGELQEVQVVDFLEHLKTHPEKADMDKVEKHLKFFTKLNQKHFGQTQNQTAEEEPDTSDSPSV